MLHPFFDSETPRVFAHRGLVTAELAASGVVENTRAAFDAAVLSGVTYIETDCHLTRDGEVIVFHDSDLVRLCGDSRQVANIPLDELREMFAHKGGLLTLREALEEFPSIRFNIDVKAAAAASAIGIIVAPSAKRVLITSFSEKNRAQALNTARSSVDGSRPATSPGQSRVIWLMLALWLRLDWCAIRLLKSVDALQIPERHGRIEILSTRLLRVAHEANVEVHVWTVNEPDRMRQLVERGVAGIVTDRADVAMRALY